MNTKLIQQFAQCLLDSAQINTGLMEKNLPLYTAERIRKKLTMPEYKMATKQSILELLKHNFTYEAMWWIGEFKEFPELRHDTDINQTAKILYEKTKNDQREDTGNLKTFFHF